MTRRLISLQLGEGLSIGRRSSPPRAPPVSNTSSWKTTSPKTPLLISRRVTVICPSSAFEPKWNASLARRADILVAALIASKTFPLRSLDSSKHLASLTKLPLHRYCAEGTQPSFQRENYSQLWPPTRRSPR